MIDWLIEWLFNLQGKLPHHYQSRNQPLNSKKSVPKGLSSKQKH